MAWLLFMFPMVHQLSHNISTNDPRPYKPLNQVLKQWRPEWRPHWSHDSGHLDSVFLKQCAGFLKIRGCCLMLGPQRKTTHSLFFTSSLNMWKESKVLPDSYFWQEQKKPQQTVPVLHLHHNLFISDGVFSLRFEVSMSVWCVVWRLLVKLGLTV